MAANIRGGTPTPFGLVNIIKLEGRGNGGEARGSGYDAKAEPITL